MRRFESEDALVEEDDDVPVYEDNAFSLLAECIFDGGDDADAFHDLTLL